MKVYIVFKHVIAWHKDVVVDSLWRSMPAAYERMESLKEGGRIEVHDLDKIKDGSEDECKHCGCYDKLQRKIQKLIYTVKAHQGKHDELSTAWVLNEIEGLKRNE